MSIRNEKHGWTKDGRSILSDESLAAVRRILDTKGSVIVEHRVYCGGGNPARLVFDDFEEFTDYLSTKARAGDNILVWSYEDLCRDENVVVQAKYPDTDGCVPTGGAY
jgi:hypothetical protein